MFHILNNLYQMRKFFPSLLLALLLLASTGVWAQGGEDCSTATLIPGLPYTDNGNTSSAVNDYDESCSPFGSPTGGQDLVYQFTPTVNMSVDLSLCGGTTNYDTRMFIYENACPASGTGGNMIACGDDECSNPPLFSNNWISEITGAFLTAGNTYYIVVDGYGSTDFGDYTLSITPAPLNVGADSLVSPLTGCGLTSTTAVEVAYQNFGPDANEVHLFLEVDGVPIVSDTVTGLFPAGGMASHVFSQPADLSAAGNHEIRFSASTPGDSNPGDDTLSTTIFNFASQSFPIPLVGFTNYDGFNLSTLYPYMAEAGGVGVPSDFSFSNWASANTTQQSALGSNTAKINLWQFGDADEWLLGPLVQITPGIELHFDAALTEFANGNPGTLGSDDSVKVMISPDCGTTWFPLMSFGAGNAPGATLTSYMVDLTPYAGLEVLVGIYATDGAVQDPTDSDFHIDNLELVDPTLTDAAIDVITSPSSSCGLTATQDISVDIVNLGPPTTELYAYLEFNGTPVVADTITGAFATGAVVAHTFSQTVDMSTAGTYDVTVAASAMGDINTSNDTLEVELASTPPVAFPLPVADMEVYNGGNLNQIHPNWTEADGTKAGPSNFAFSDWAGPSGTQTAGFGTTTIRYNLYTTNQNSWIVGPNVIATANTQLQFDAAVTSWTNMAIDSMGSDDSVLVMVSTDCGDTWTEVLAITEANEPPAELTPFVADLSAYAGQEIQVAIFGTSGPTAVGNHDYDFHLDNLNLNNFFPVDVSVTAILNPVDGCSLTASEAIAAEITHVGTDTVFGPAVVPMKYQIDSNPIVEDSLVLAATDTLPPGASGIFVFATTGDFSNLGATYDLQVWADLGDPQPINDSLDVSFTTEGATPITAMAPSAALCNTGDSVIFTANYRGGEWMGPGVVDSLNGLFDPELMPAGDSVMITYYFDQDYGMYEIPFAPQPTTGGTPLGLGDDDFTSVSIGFNFEFGGATYTDVFVGSNGFISFGEGSTSLSNQELPSVTTPNNLVALAWDDLNPSANGDVVTMLMGTAPNQMLVIDYDSVQHYGNTSAFVDGQIILYEGTNIIEMHISSIDTDGFGMTQGVESSDGSKGYATSDSTNDEAFTQSMVAYRFEPTSCPGSDTVMVYIGPKEPFADDTTNLCMGDTATLDALNAGGTYLWSTAATTQTIDINMGGTFYVDYTDANGCAGTDTVVVETLPGLSVAVDGSTDALCFGDTNGSIDLGVTGPSSPFTFMWSSGDTTEDLSGLPAGTYEVAVTDTNGCVDELSVEISEPDSIVLNGAVIDASCPDDMDGQVAVSPTGGTGTFTFVWSDASTDATLAGVGAGTYTVTATDMNGCTSTDSFMVVSTDSLPEAGFSFSVDGDEVSFTNTSVNADTYSWFFGDLGGTVSSDEEPVFEYNLDGNYIVTLIVSNDCGSDTITQEVGIATSISTPDLGEAVKVAPNPNAGTFTLLFDGNNLSNVQVELTDARGRAVYRTELGTVASGATHMIDLEGKLPEGLYMLRVRSEQGQTVRQIAVQ